MWPCTGMHDNDREGNVSNDAKDNKIGSPQTSAGMSERDRVEYEI